MVQQKDMTESKDMTEGTSNASTASPLRIDADYGHTVKLGHISQEFLPGKIYGLKGANGAGKSTALATLCGEIMPIDGEVLLDGKEPGSRANAGRIINVADPVFLPDISVGEHFELLARRTGTDFAEVIDLWALEPLLKQPAFRLSSGQQQRVFLASQLYQPADVLTIDEPERHLDAEWTKFLASELRHLAGLGRCIVLASHSPAIFEACDEVVSVG
ncbi:ABC transporter ATP-binding protein [Corynebacterium simulans]